MSGNTGRVLREKKNQLEREKKVQVPKLERLNNAGCCIFMAVL